MSDPSSASEGDTRDVGWTGPSRAGPWDGDTPADLARRGREIGRYIVIERLGAGGMGEVLAAYDPELDRRVALKLVAVHGRMRARERTLREAQALAKLSHPNVVTVYDAGTYDAGVFIAMEHIDGETLKEWLSGTKRSWREILELLVHAGRGLAAAHAAGLVHRDFKPANVMVGRDGRVRVLDFGLARRLDDAESDDASGVDPAEIAQLAASGPRPVGPLTETGLVMGTPAFMAPEQFFGGTIDARTDQFAFCIVAWRALFGVAPFEGRSFEELGRAVSRGELGEVPKNARIPRGVRDALRRGLSVGSSERYATMDALLGVLERARRGGRRRTMMWILSATVVGLAAAGTMASLPGDKPCEGLDAHLHGVWDDDRRARMATAFSAIDAPYAEHAAREVTRTLDAYADAWLSMRVESCEATRVRADQTETLLDVRNGCLDERRRALDALAHVLEAADERVAERSLDAAQRLPPIEPCADTERLLADVRPPVDPEVAREVDELRGELARARARLYAGQFTAALAPAERILARARALEYLPLHAEAANLVGQAQEHLGQAEAGVTAWEDGLQAAAASGHARAEAEALLGLASVHGTGTRDTTTALRYVRHARAVLVRLGEPPELAALASLYAGNAHVIAHAWAEAEVELQRTLEIVADRPALRRLEIAALGNLASSRGSRGQYRAAARAIEDAIVVAQERLGPYHPLVGSLHNNLGATHARAGAADTAIAALDRALEIGKDTIGRMHPETARALQNRGVAWTWKNEVARAEADFLAALEIRTKLVGESDPSLAGPEINLADLLVHTGRPAEARPRAERALRLLVDAVGAEHLQTIYARTTLGDVLLAVGEPSAAHREVEIALGIAETAEIDPFQRAALWFVAARAEWEIGGDRGHARELAERALGIYRSPERERGREIPQIEAWLAAHMRR